MPEEGKTDSESSCSFFGKRKAVTRKNALRLQKIRLETPGRGLKMHTGQKGRTPAEGVSKNISNERKSQEIYFFIDKHLSKRLSVPKHGKPFCVYFN